MLRENMSRSTRATRPGRAERRAARMSRNDRHSIECQSDPTVTLVSAVPILYRLDWVLLKLTFYLVPFRSVIISLMPLSPKSSLCVP